MSMRFMMSRFPLGIPADVELQPNGFQGKRKGGEKKKKRGKGKKRDT